MIPSGYIGLVVADTRRALQWEAGLEREGCKVMRVETRGADADKGAWHIAVRRDHATRAQALVTSVLRGETKLPHRAMLSRSSHVALVAIALVIALVLGVVGFGVLGH